MKIRNTETSVISRSKVSRQYRYCGLLLAALLLFAAVPARAQETPPRTVLRVGTTDAPPFAVKLDNGQWSGISIELWRELATGLGLRFELEERTLPEFLTGLQDGSLDAGVTAITITADREKVMDFTHPFFVTGLATAVRTEGATLHWLHVAEKFFSLHFLYLVGALTLVLLVAGFLVWIFERRNNADQFISKMPKGIGEGIWWAVVTMTTVGYGDKSPKSLGGRVVAIVWMFSSIIILSSFTAAITSSLTVSQLGASVQGLPDLKRVRVGSLKDSTGEAFLTGQDVEFRELRYDGRRPAGARRRQNRCLRSGRPDFEVPDPYAIPGPTAGASADFRPTILRHRPPGRQQPSGTAQPVAPAVYSDRGLESAASTVFGIVVLGGEIGG